MNVDYFTDAIRYTQVRVLEIAEEERIAGPAARAHGDVLVRSQVVGFKKIKFFTNENVGSGKLELPENEMHTTAFWVTLEHELLTSLPFKLSERQSGIFGLLYALESMATLLLMCDRRDLGTAIGERPPTAGAWTRNGMEFAAATGHPIEKEFFEPNLYLYDAYPGGIGFSEPLYRMPRCCCRARGNSLRDARAKRDARRVSARRARRASAPRKRRWRSLNGFVPEKTRTLIIQIRVSHMTLDRLARLKALQRALLMTLYGTGMRRTEVSLLKLSDIDSQRMMIRVERGKGGAGGDIPLSPALLDTLRKYWRWKKPRIYLFPSSERNAARSGLSPTRPCGMPVKKPLATQVSPSGSALIACGTASPPTCWKRGQTYAPFRFYWATVIWKRRPNTCIFRNGIYGPSPIPWKLCHFLSSRKLTVSTTVKRTHDSACRGGG